MSHDPNVLLATTLRAAGLGCRGGRLVREGHPGHPFVTVEPSKVPVVGVDGRKGVDVMEDWVAQACTLPPAAQPLRVSEFDQLFATALERVDRPEPGWLRLHLVAGDQVADRTQDLVARESRCCSFFSFEVTASSSGLVVDVRVPAARIAVLDALEQRAGAVVASCRKG